MTGRDEDIPFEEAARWHALIQSDDADWDAFARWLEAAPMNQRAYEQIALIDDEVTRWAARHDVPVVQPVEPIRDRLPGRGWWIAGGALAASLAVVVAVPRFMTAAEAPPVYYSANAGQQLVKLRDGSSARLDRGTRLTIADGGKGRITMESGAAYFDVRHDPDRAFVVQAGEFVIRDIGTRFAVTRRGTQMSVAVEEGVVDVSWRGSAATLLKAGQKLDASGTRQDAEIRDVDPATVASWRDGRLIYDNTPLSLVAADISRYTSDPIAVDPAVANLKLSGILLIEDGSHLVDQIKALLPVDSRREGHLIRLVRVPARR
jgi:transmembrane sensor